MAKPRRRRHLHARRAALWQAPIPIRSLLLVLQAAGLLPLLLLGLLGAARANALPLSLRLPRAPVSLLSGLGLWSELLRSLVVMRDRARVARGLPDILRVLSQ